MSKFWSFIKTAVLGGVTVLLPAAILIWVFQWVFRFVVNLIEPLSSFIAEWVKPLVEALPDPWIKSLGLTDFEVHIPIVLANILAIIVIASFCFTVGVTVKTRMGGWLFHHVENSLLRVAPGYTTVKEIVMQFLGNKTPPFSRVALVRLFNSETYVTTFVTDEHEDGSFTVFMPTGPNPTSGWIYHVPASDVTLLDVSVDVAMRTVISCGVGSKPLVSSFNELHKKEAEA